MDSNRKIIAWIAGLGLGLAAMTAQAGNVGFSISYSDYDHHSKYSYRSYAYPANHVIQYNYHPYYGVKHYKHDRHYKRHHYDSWHPKHYYDRHHYKHYDHYKHKRHHDAYYYKDKHKYYGGYGGHSGHYHGNAYCKIRH